VTGRDEKTLSIFHEIYRVTGNLLLLKAKFESRGFSVILPFLYEYNYRGVDEQESYNRFFTEVGIEKGSSIISSLIEKSPDSEIFLMTVNK